MATNEIKSKTQWMKFDSVQDLHFIGKGYVAFSGGCHIFFGDLTSDEDIIYRANCPSQGDGVQCMAVHKKYPVFAFAEMCLNPRILLYSFPDFECIKTIEDMSFNGYIQLAFSEKEYLLALGTYPDFTLFVWNWRSGEFIASCNTNIHSRQQCLRWNLGTPPIISQYTLIGSQTVYLWEFHVCYTACKVSQRVVEIPIAKHVDISDSIWSPEGILYIVDSNGNIFSVEAEENNAKLTLKWDGMTGRLKPCAVWFKNGILLSGPSGEVRLCHYTAARRQSIVGGPSLTITWKTEWTAHPQYGFSALCSSEHQETNILLGMTVRSELYSLTNNQLVLLKNYGNKIQSFDFLYPKNDSVVTLTVNGDLLIWSRWKGYKEGGIFVGKCCISMQANPAFPYVAFGRSDGYVQYISLYHPHQPAKLFEMCLCREELTTVMFTNKGNHLLACSKDSGHIFVLTSPPNTSMSVMAHRKLEFKIAAISVLEHGENIRISVVINMLECCQRGGKLVEVYTARVVSDSSTQLLQQIYTLRAKNDYLNFIYHPFTESILFAIPHRSRKLHVFSVNPQAQSLKYRNSLSTGHQCRKYSVTMTNGFILTYGYDGLIFLRNADYDYLAAILPHHRADGGVKKATVDATGRYILSLGEDGHFVCTFITYSTPLQETKNINLFNDKDMVKLLAKEEYSFAGIDKNKSWLETQEDRRSSFENEQSSEIKSQIMEQTKALKLKVIRLLEKNLTGPPEEKLPIGEFDLNVRLREERICNFNEDLQKTLMRKRAIMAAQKKLTDKIKSLTWNSMDVKIQRINGFLRNFNVESYPLFTIDTNIQKQVEEIDRNQKIVQGLEQVDRFLPWMPREDYEDVKLPEINRIFSKEPKLLTNEKIMTWDDTFLSGSSTYLYINPSLYQLTQFEITSYSHVHKEIIILRKITRELQLHFNVEFKKVQDRKDRELALLQEKNNRLQHLLSELNVVDREIEDFRWSPQEKSEKIVIVEDEEVSVPPYISPSEQEILNKKAAEEEARRLAELADDFREKALIRMMDGVLELRWEDKIKRDIPKPKCLLEKSPENWSEDDLCAIRDYDEQVRFIVGERLRYREICIEEFETIVNMQRESMRKFDEQLHELHLLRNKIEGCIGQELLKILRQRERIYQRIELSESETEMLKNICLNDTEIEELEDELQNLNDVRNECQAMYEDFKAKEKILEKGFRKEFQDSIPIIHAQLYKLYKRRPKMYHRVQLSGSLLNELSGCILSTTSEENDTRFLPPDCIQYLQTLEKMDDVSNAPPLVAEEHWNTMCHLRRVRIEFELKTKSVALQLAEANNTLNIYNKKLVALKLKREDLLEELKLLKDKKLELNHNIKLQMVFKQGIVEVALSGSTEDYENCILLRRGIIEDINKDILKAGEKKLYAMQELTNFHRVIMQREWEHKRLRMEIEDHKNILATIQHIKLTREMQQYLRRLEAGISEEQNYILMDKEVTSYKQIYEKLIKALKEQLIELNIKLRIVKKENTALDARIIDLNVDVNELRLQKDDEFEEEKAKFDHTCMQLIFKRSNTIKKIQEQHNEILLLQTELELLRLRTYPTLKYNTL